MWFGDNLIYTVRLDTLQCNLTATAGSRKTPAPFLQNEDFSAVVYIPSTTCMLLMGGGHSGLLSFKKLLTTSPTLLRQ
ncbi:hypothetical protein F2P79_004106 [Pimephales promelas]|nr:hypothetical protein F2P79_004106 [Pimephales promelas]